jgi:F-type H+-transporting ATPase subunit delta
VADDRRVKGYAEAILAVAEAEGDLENVEDELFRFGRIVESRPDLREALTDPALPADRKTAVVDDLLEGKASKNTVALLNFLLQQGRARELPRIIQALSDLAAERRRTAIAEVRTAVPLDEFRRARLQEALSKATGRNVELRVLVDASVMGGVVARIGDQVFDGTVRRKLEVAREQLTRAR